eukprot:4445810-Heterocapsa_arctica.AAC.1
MCIRDRPGPDLRERADMRDRTPDGFCYVCHGQPCHPGHVRHDGRHRRRHGEVPARSPAAAGRLNAVDHHADLGKGRRVPALLVFRGGLVHWLRDLPRGH